ncbi:glycoside hydrolase family 2 TIM barrel-domain containing protein [Streptomyces europaeiscabiei]|uniref:glycoside hydrolase family 2 TIM barrel-domain containing protein n=1 Tax=Streptomyces europaeiscabiei TaxID=146819 RepID=UPI0029B44FC7|nr:glycoside hydrolase family 2 TIM barrel-domain containing protein [Streptomyces europaeiscabiei]MDX3710866.1 glycoside hydrolase family 2 TIM barrel-domain containing protein [Streptomyces europaeiscabiei]MDX3843468.1 glycoside hydrolase family 2 TIM barrel-domain containing protein [Streptomyces europaeiscabiei]
MTVTRRSLLVAGTSAPVVGALAGTAAAAPRARPSSAGRAVPLRDGWRFALVDPGGITDPTGEFTDAAKPGFDDSAWRQVAVPHDWSIELAPTTRHGTTSGTGFFPGGLGWYRNTFTLPPALAGKRISVEFDGVYMDSHVHCNGTEVGRHPYGYTGFAFDLTDLLHTDGTTENVIAVKVQNRLPSSRWYSGSGIYREARLVVTDPVHVARWGTHVTTPDITEERALVRVRTSVVNASGGAADVEVVSRVVDARGRTVARTSSTVAVTDTATATHELTVREPRLWDFADPHRYTLRTELRVGGRAADTHRTPFGIRTFRFDPDDGFHLNGAHHKIKGVDLHHDLGALGAAVSADAIRRQMTIMKSMGVNAFRTSHNPPSPEMIEVCEELGIVMMVEAFDCWRSPKTRYDYGRFFDEWADRDVTEMVLAARNSPAVLMWSIGNEVSEFTSTSGLAMADRLIAAVKACDDTRPIVIGSHRHRSVPAPGSPGDLILAKLDGLGLNYNTAKSVDALHARYPKLFLFESESSSETSTRGVYQEPEHLNTGENHTPGKRGVSSYDNNLASWTMSGEYGHKKDRDRKWFAGQFLWSGIDYIGEPTPYDVFPVKASFFGAVDTAGFPKDMYYLFQSQWISRPMVHLLPMTWNHAKGDTVEVWAYSNVDTVELFLNGKSLGTRTFDEKRTLDGRPYLETTEAPGDDKTFTDGPYPGSYTSPNGSAGKLHLAWQVPYAAGELKAVARRNGRTVATDVLRTAGAPHGVRLTADRKSLAADGRSLAFVTAEIVDARGVVVPDAEHLISFDVRGGSLAGLDNGREESAERYQASTRTAFGGRALAIVRAGVEPGPVRVTARAEGLRTGKVSVRATSARGRVTTPAAEFEPDHPAAPDHPRADASYSGRPDTLPAAMLDGDPATGWSNAFLKAATALLPAFSGARPVDWVSVDWGRPGTVDRVEVSFTVDAGHTLPEAVGVEVWDGSRYVPAEGAKADWATTSDAPTAITFAPLRGTRVRLTLTSRHPGEARGAVRISRLDVLAV